MKIPIKISLFNLGLSLVIAIFLMSNYRFYFMGMQRGAAGLGAALVAVLIPIFVYIFMIFSKKSKPLIKDWAALLVGTIGVLLMMNFDQTNLALLISGGNLYFILAALTYAAITIIGAYMKNMHVLAFNFYISLFGFIMAFVYSYDASLLVTLMEMDYIFWINILFVSVIAGTAIGSLYYAGIRIIGSKKTSVFSLLTPFFAIAFGAIFFQEVLNLQNIIGIILAVSALFVLIDLKLKAFLPSR